MEETYRKHSLILTHGSLILLMLDNILSFVLFDCLFALMLYVHGCLLYTFKQFIHAPGPYARLGWLVD